MAIKVTELNLPSVSPEGMKALGIISSAEPDTQELEKTILHDPVLASTLIKYANSPLYRRPNKITSVPAAMRTLGHKNIRSAVVMATMRSAIENDNQVNQIIWDHCMEIALLCKLITQRTCAALSDEMEFLGLIHGMGMLVLANNFPEEYLKIIKTSIQDQVPVDHLEEDQLEMIHDNVMIKVSEKFRLPEGFARLLGAYHQHEGVNAIETEHQRMLCILDLAHHLWMEAGTSAEQFRESIVESRDRLLHLLQLDEAAIQQLKDEYASLISTPQ